MAPAVIAMDRSSGCGDDNKQAAYVNAIFLISYKCLIGEKDETGNGVP
jgi:hypothetical protein